MSILGAIKDKLQELGPEWVANAHIVTVVIFGICFALFHTPSLEVGRRCKLDASLKARHAFPTLEI